MKKILCTLLAVLLIIAMAVPAYAVTPRLEIPDMPEVPDISDDVSVELPGEFWDKYFQQNAPGWREWLHSWYLRRAELFSSGP